MQESEKSADIHIMMQQVCKDDDFPDTVSTL